MFGTDDAAFAMASVPAMMAARLGPTGAAAVTRFWVVDDFTRSDDARFAMETQIAVQVIGTEHPSQVALHLSWLGFVQKANSFR